MVTRKKQTSSIFNSKIWLSIIFVLLSIQVVIWAGNILEPQDDIKDRWESFYSLPENSLDILILGNSHAYSTYDPNIIDAICGTNSFVLASNSQKIEQTYFNLKEALRYQSPKIVMIQASVLTGDSWKSSPGDYRVFSNLDGMRFSLEKIEAVLAQRPLNEFLSGMFSIFRNHYHWKDAELISSNLKHFEEDPKHDFRGFSPRSSTMSSEIAKQYENDKKSNFQNYKITASDKKYLEKIGRLADLMNFRLIYVMSPKYIDVINVNYVNKYKKLKKTTLEYASTYLDYNTLADEVGIEQISFENGHISYQHTSHYGANQISIHLAKYLNENLKSEFHHNKRRMDEQWKRRMKQKPEKYIFREKDETIANNLKKLGSNLSLFEDVKIENLYLLKDEQGADKLIVEFSKGLNLSKISQYKFYIHLYPGLGDNNIREERKEYGFENYDFNPRVLPKKDGGYYVIREISTRIKNAQNLDIGLFGSGLKKSEKVSFESVEF